MSLLDRGNTVVTVYPEATAIDDDGNPITKASTTGTAVRASVQPLTAVYRLRLAGSGPVLGAQAEIEWEGRRYSIIGPPVRFTGSRRTAHVIYTMARS